MAKDMSSYLDLPDDQIGAFPFNEEATKEADKPAQEAVAEEPEVVEETAEVTEVEATTEVTDDADGSEDSGYPATNEVVDKEKPKETNSDAIVDKEEKVDTIDYKAEYERLTAPFKANGREISVKSVDDAVALMQMGANYSKKMAGLKPHLRVVKMLEKHGLLDESKLSYLIDLQSKNPEAIAKLVKDSGLNPLEMDTESSTDYKPKNYSVDDREIELDSVLEDIKESPNYQRTISTVSNDWDNASKQEIATNPELLKIINSHMDSGVFDVIKAELDNERLFGRLNGLSDLDAYKKVGDSIHARGGFDFLAKKQQTRPNQPVTVPKPVVQVDEKAKDKKRAAAPVKTASATQVTKEFNPLALSDEEFSKLAKTQYM